MAIGRGFSPKKAFSLFDENVNLYIIDLQDFLRSPSDIQRVKSRIIGTKGKTRRIIEEETMTSLSIYGDTISIIGDIEHLKVAKEAIDMFIRGAYHRSVYRYLNMKRNELREIEMELWKSPP
jgi:ribosomal RNA assembly protein